MSTPAPEMIARLAEFDVADQVKHAKAIKDVKPIVSRREQAVFLATLIVIDLFIVVLKDSGQLSNVVGNAVLVAALPLTMLTIQMQAVFRRLNALAFLALERERERELKESMLRG